MKKTVRSTPNLWLRVMQWLGLFSLSLSLIIACQQTPKIETSPTANSSTGTDRITIGTTLKARTLDPADTYEMSSLFILYNVMETLYTYEEGTTTLKPLLAKDFPTVSQDGLTYTIPLQEGVKFHDGEPFNATAMKFSLDRFIQNSGKPSFLLSDIVKSIEVSDEKTLKITLKKVFSAFPSLLAYPGACAVSPKAYKIGVNQFNPNRLVGTGKYTLTQFSSDTIKLDIFTDYWGEKPQNKGIDIAVYAGNSANLFNSFRTQAIDIAFNSLDPEQIKSLLNDSSQQFKAIEASGTNISYMTLNLKQAPLDKLEVRQALAYLVDRKLLVDRILQGQGEPLYSLIPVAFKESFPVFQTLYQETNYTKAKTLLEQAGFSATNPAKIQVWYSSGSTVRAMVAQTLQALADKELGGLLKFEANTVESATFFGNVSKGIYPSTLSDWYPDFLDADNFLQPLLQCDQGTEKGCDKGSSQSQGSFYYNPKFNGLIDAERKEQDATKRLAIFKEMQDIVAQDVPIIPLWQSKAYTFVNSKISGVQLNPSQMLAFWTIKKS